MSTYQALSLAFGETGRNGPLDAILSAVLGVVFVVDVGAAKTDGLVGGDVDLAVHHTSAVQHLDS